jgi:hypothetical protein
LPVNLIDPQSINSYLEGFLPSNPEAAKLLQLALAKPLAQRGENASPVDSLPDDAPVWLKRKWPQGGPYHRFTPDADLDDKVRHIADWIKAALTENEPWLRQLTHGKPSRFTSINTLEDATEMADADMRERNQKLAARLGPGKSGEETVMAMAGGFRMVRLVTPEALDRESVGMGHCIGQGSYDQYLKDGSREFYSLRDARNQPHATVEVDVEKHAVLQCQGKENHAPVGKRLVVAA